MLAHRDIVDLVVSCAVGSAADSSTLDRDRGIGDMLLRESIYHVSKDVGVAVLRAYAVV
jgi:hypothetical protein